MKKLAQYLGFGALIVYCLIYAFYPRQPEAHESVSAQLKSLFQTEYSAVKRAPTESERLEKAEALLAKTSALVEKL